MNAVRIVYRLALLGLVVATGAIFTALFQRGSLPPTGLRSYVTRWWHRSIANSLGVKVHVYGTPRKHATLFVSNHVSTFDIVALGSVLPVRFLSKAEVRRWPLLGWLASRAGTLYIARGDTRASAEANIAMAEALSLNHNILLFAEGRITDGHVRRFHSRLLQSAVDSSSQVQPVAIRYPCPAGGKVHKAAMTDDHTSFAASAWRLIGARQLEVEIHFASAVSAQNKSRHELARYAENVVRKLVEGPPVDATRTGEIAESGQI